MITVTQNNFVYYDSIENRTNLAVFYPDLCSGKIVKYMCRNLNKKSVLSLTMGLAHLTGKIFKIKREKDPPGPQACMFLSKTRFTMTDRQTRKKIQIKGDKGSLIIFGGMFRERWKYQTPKASLNLFEENPLSYIYLSADERIKYSKKVHSTLEKLSELPIGQQCPQKYLELDELIGTGSYGNVYKAERDGMNFAVKLSKLKENALDEPYSKEVSSWYEVHFLREILKPLIQKDICPNFPLLFDTFACQDCDLKLDNEHIHLPCVVTMIELADGDLKYFLRDMDPSPEEIYSALFQVMVAIHTIQLNGQIMNFDIKKENILFYNVEPGGYWQYTVHGKNYYVPNHGKLFILNDFGISRSMSPDFPLYKSKDDITFRLGSRYAVVQGKEFVPINTSFQPNPVGEPEDNVNISWTDGTKSTGSQFRMYRINDKIINTDISIPDKTKKYLKSKGIPCSATNKKFFLHPEIIPPFEFYNDTQDGIRSFIGGKRTTQRGNHRLYPIIPETMIEQLEKYNGEGESMKDCIFSKDPSQVLAGYFIESFFTKYTTYTKQPKGIKLSTYVIS